MLTFGHALTTQQWTGVALVFVGLTAELYDEFRKDKAKEHASSDPAKKDK